MLDMKTLKISFPNTPNVTATYELPDDSDFTVMAKCFINISPNLPVHIPTKNEVLIIGSDILKQSIITLKDVKDAD